MDRPGADTFRVLDAGELLLTSGAEAARVEDTMRRLARAYGFVRADVLTITASMAVTVRTADDQVITQTRRILRRGTDMRCIEAGQRAVAQGMCESYPAGGITRTSGSHPHRTG